MTTALLWLGLICAIITLVFDNLGYERAARNWSYAQMVPLWIFFLLK